MSPLAAVAVNAKVFTVQQGSPEWHAARVGACTASMFSEVRIRPERGPNKAIGFSAKAQAYAFRLACERITGEALADAEQFETYAMRRGHELEPAARAEHEAKAGVMVEPCGFICTEDGKFGASADGFLYGQRAGAEYKCLVDPERIAAVILSEDVSEFMDQIQGGIWLSGMDRWHFGLYCPSLEAIGGPLWWRIVERDDDYIEALEQDLLRFDQYVTSIEDKLRRVRWAPGAAPVVTTTPPWEPEAPKSVTVGVPVAAF